MSKAVAERATADRAEQLVQSQGAELRAAAESAGLLSERARAPRRGLRKALGDCGDKATASRSHSIVQKQNSQGPKDMVIFTNTVFYRLCNHTYCLVSSMNVYILSYIGIRSFM